MRWNYTIQFTINFPIDSQHLTTFSGFRGKLPLMRPTWWKACCWWIHVFAKNMWAKRRPSQDQWDLEGSVARCSVGPMGQRPWKNGEKPEEKPFKENHTVGWLTSLTKSCWSFDPLHNMEEFPHVVLRVQRLIIPMALVDSNPSSRALAQHLVLPLTWNSCVYVMIF